MSMSHTRTQRLTLIAILSAISFGLMLFPQIPLIPGADFLKLDFSIVPVIIAGYWLDLPAALWTVLLRTILKLILANEGVNTYLGLPVNLVAIVIFTAILFWLLPHFNVKSLSRQVLAIVAATLGLTIAGVLMNWLVAVPLYAQFANFDIAKMIGLGKYFVGMVIPFNIAQGIIWGIVSFAVLSLLKPIQHKVTA
ncbi:ECF transporter S component [Leuconostoc holzapfelii]|uniref:Riboflavin transporter n=1 Tax=Leuconostoc holzapfelii TaxID=434464 RepID=A0A846Z8D6_9LACO|nr:ECF transporter S component [Leuconostoc holzapfelii]NKZ17606.1 ECF transporter S component [Leuconostoc holzapfelii]